MYFTWGYKCILFNVDVGHWVWYMEKKNLFNEVSCQALDKLYWIQWCHATYNLKYKYLMTNYWLIALQGNLTLPTSKPIYRESSHDIYEDWIMYLTNI